VKVKLDENIPAGLVRVLEGLGHEVDTVASEGLKGAVDESVWAAAGSEDRFLVTQDLDFSDIRRFRPGSHPGLLLVRLREPGRTAVRRRVEGLFRTEDVDSWSGCFVVATDRKVRVRRRGA
jgi:predicted nuclease of predicted toxin-antitoxin system